MLLHQHHTHLHSHCLPLPVMLMLVLTLITKLTMMIRESTLKYFVFYCLIRKSINPTISRLFWILWFQLFSRDTFTILAHCISIILMMFAQYSVNNKWNGLYFIQAHATYSCLIKSFSPREMCKAQEIFIVYYHSTENDCVEFHCAHIH